MQWSVFILENSSFYAPWRRASCRQGFGNSLGRTRCREYFRYQFLQRSCAVHPVLPPCGAFGCHAGHWHNEGSRTTKSIQRTNTESNYSAHRLAIPRGSSSLHSSGKLVPALGAYSVYMCVLKAWSFHGSNSPLTVCFYWGLLNRISIGAEADGLNARTKDLCQLSMEVSEISSNNSCMWWRLGKLKSTRLICFLHL